VAIPFSLGLLFVFVNWHASFMPLPSAILSLVNPMGFLME
jgi:hypothetical protein